MTHTHTHHIIQQDYCSTKRVHTYRDNSSSDCVRNSKQPTRNNQLPNSVYSSLESLRKHKAHGEGGGT